jgi:hypothetical protein
MVTLHPFLADFCIRFWPIFYTGVLGRPIYRQRSADRVIILHTLYGQVRAIF